MKRGSRRNWWTLVLLMLALLPACNGGLGAFQAGVGDTPDQPPLAAFRILGQPGLQFSGIISDATSTWKVAGSVPLNIVIVNNQTPVRLTVTKLSPGSGILSVQLTLGFVVQSVSSTNDPYGSTSIQNNPLRPGFAPPPPFASPDVRLFVRGPATERFSGIFEDTETAFILSDRVPLLVLFDNPNGPVDATLTQIQNLGSFNVDLLFNGDVVAHATGGPTITIRQP